ncbi:hypothetical protein BH11BAC4_BH11BAC4_19180 [soil metagenome]
MKISIFISLLFFISTGFLSTNSNGSRVDKSAYYAALSSSKEAVINTQLAALQLSSIPEKEAYEGALLMKKSGLIKSGAKEKLNLFKAGRTKLEDAITKDNNNIEYRFLRLIIQENAPKIVKYRNDMEQDSQLVRTNFKNLPQNLQLVITDYSKTSKVLKI